MTPPINPPTHIGGGAPKISNLQTELKYLDSRLIEFLLIWGIPLKGGWVVGALDSESNWPMM